MPHGYSWDDRIMLENTVQVLEDKEGKKEIILERNPLKVFNLAKSLCLLSGEKRNLQA